MPDYPATTLAKNKGKYYVLLTIPAELRQHFKGQKQLKKSTGTSDLGDAKRRQHNISAELYAKLDACKPDIRDVISDLLGWIGDADEVQRLEDNGDLESIIMSHKYAEDTHDPERDKDESCIDLVHAGGAAALDVYREWKAQKTAGQPGAFAPVLSAAFKEYLETSPYKTEKTTRECEHASEQFIGFAGDLPLDAITAVKVHEFAEFVGNGRSRKLIDKKVGYVRRMYDFALRKGWVAVNVFTGIKLDKNLGTPTQSYIPLTHDELGELFALDMPVHLRRLFSILVASGMRLDEAALLNWEHVKYDKAQDTLYFDTTENAVKNGGSRRKVPVHPVLDWIEAGQHGPMFPEFPRDRDGKTQSASSKALMQYIRRVTPRRQKAVHSLRGNFKDMLRDAGVSKEINDFITGHDEGDVAGKYGVGPSLKVRKEAIERLRFPYLEV